MTVEQMKIELADFFDAMKNILGYDKPQDLKKLKNSRQNNCIFAKICYNIVGGRI